MGILLVCLLGWVWMPPGWLAGVMLVPMVADGFIQALTRYESRNPRRFITGVLFGIGLSVLVAMYYSWLYRQGYQFAMRRFGT